MLKRPPVVGFENNPPSAGFDPPNKEPDEAGFSSFFSVVVEFPNSEL